VKRLTPIDLTELIIDNYDPDIVVELLDLSTEDLLNRFQDVLWDRRYRFSDLYEDDENDQEDTTW
jgi:hypothetical protein